MGNPHAIVFDVGLHRSDELDEAGAAHFEVAGRRLGKRSSSCAPPGRRRSMFWFGSAAWAARWLAALARHCRGRAGGSDRACAVRPADHAALAGRRFAANRAARRFGGDAAGSGAVRIFWRGPGAVSFPALGARAQRRRDRPRRGDDRAHERATLKNSGDRLERRDRLGGRLVARLRAGAGRGVRRRETLGDSGGPAVLHHVRALAPNVLQPALTTADCPDLGVRGGARRHWRAGQAAFRR